MIYLINIKVTSKEIVLKKYEEKLPLSSQYFCNEDFDKDKDSKDIDNYSRSEMNSNWILVHSKLKKNKSQTNTRSFKKVSCQVIFVIQ